MYLRVFACVCIYRILKFNFFSHVFDSTIVFACVCVHKFNSPIVFAHVCMYLRLEVEQSNCFSLS